MSYDNYNSSSKKRKAKKRKKRRIALFIIELLILAVMACVLFIVMKWDKIQKDTLSEGDIYYNEGITAAENGSEDTWKMQGYKNIALFGVDAGETRTDSIIIASLNQDTGDIKLCSVYRDSYLNIGNDTYNKANSAYAHGGAEQAIKMINMNLDMTVDDYIAVNFQALEDVINDLGGIEINVEDAEISFLNDYQTSIVEGIGGGPKTGEQVIPVTQAGLQTLNGLQATAYCRIRYTKGDDYRRTERQREVLKQIASKAKAADLGTLNKIIDDVFPECKTSFTAAEFAEYASKAASYNISDTTGFPFEKAAGNMGKAGSCVVADNLAQNVTELHTFFFGASDYTPTDTVQEISNKVAADKAKNGL